MRVLSIAYGMAGVTVIRLMKIVFDVLGVQSLNDLTVLGIFAVLFMDRYDSRRSRNYQVMLRKHSFE